MEPARCVVVEDSRIGLLAAKAAGMRCGGRGGQGRPRCCRLAPGRCARYASCALHALPCTLVPAPTFTSLHRPAASFSMHELQAHASLLRWPVLPSPVPHTST